MCLALPLYYRAWQRLFEAETLKARRRQPGAEAPAGRSQQRDALTSQLEAGKCQVVRKETRSLLDQHSGHRSFSGKLSRRTTGAPVTPEEHFPEDRPRAEAVEPTPARPHFNNPPSTRTCVAVHAVALPRRHNMIASGSKVPCNDCKTGGHCLLGQALHRQKNR